MRKAEFSLSEAILELLLLGFFVLLVFTIANRASSSTIPEQEHIANSAVRLINVLSYSSTPISAKLETSLLENPRITTTHSGTEGEGALTVKPADDERSITQKYNKKLEVSISATENLPVTLSTTTKEVIVTTDRLPDTCKGIALPRFALAAERAFETLAQGYNKAFSERFIGEVAIIDNLDQTILLAGDAPLFLLITSSENSIKINPKTQDLKEVLGIACTLKTSIEARGIPILIKYTTTAQETKHLPENRPGIILALKPTLNAEDTNKIGDALR